MSGELDGSQSTITEEVDGMLTSWHFIPSPDSLFYLRNQDWLPQVQGLMFFPPCWIYWDWRGRGMPGFVCLILSCSTLSVLHHWSSYPEPNLERSLGQIACDSMSLPSNRLSPRWIFDWLGVNTDREDGNKRLFPTPPSSSNGCSRRVKPHLYCPWTVLRVFSDVILGFLKRKGAKSWKGKGRYSHDDQKELSKWVINGHVKSLPICFVLIPQSSMIWQVSGEVSVKTSCVNERWSLWKHPCVISFSLN